MLTASGLSCAVHLWGNDQTKGGAGQRRTLAGHTVLRLSCQSSYGDMISQGRRRTAQDILQDALSYASPAPPSYGDMITPRAAQDSAGHLQDTLSCACPARPSYGEVIKPRAVQDSTGHLQDTLSCACPAPPLMEKRHAGHLTPFGLYNINSDEVWCGTGCQPRASIVCHLVVQTVRKQMTF